MSLLDEFKSKKSVEGDLNSGLELKDLEDQPPSEPEKPSAQQYDFEDTKGVNANPNFGGTDTQQPEDDKLRHDVALMLEKLDTVKSQLQTIQSRLDRIEHG
jgi:hypothetical protein